MKIGKHDIEITHGDKVLFPDNNITKQDVVDYYNKISKWMLPHIKDRLLTLQRFPNGISKAGFYQKDRSDYFPSWIKSKEIKKEGGKVDQLICNDRATLVYLANQGTITFHIWLSKVKAIDCPDKLIFDLDPPGNDFAIVKKAAYKFKDFMENEMDMSVFLMTTGSKGLHVVAPLKAKDDFDTVRAFARNISTYLAKKYPDDYTVEIRKDKRKGRLFLDYLRNAYAQTGVAPYSIRAIKGAPVATPITWSDLKKKGFNSQSYNINNIFKRLSSLSVDPWEGFSKKAKSISKAVKRLDKILERAT